MGLRFEVVATYGLARRGRLATRHGILETPAFMPVGTAGAVKGATVGQLENAGAQIVLANLYHLTLRPGIDVIEGLGGLHRFTGWRRPMLTDSGGYQVYSLAARRRIDDGGVTFRSHIDGAEVRFTPEGVVEAQQRLGVDIAMVLDECPPWPISERDAADSLHRTHLWAERARRRWSGGESGGLFGIVQGSAYRPLRRRSVAVIADLDFDGHAIGGVSVGEDRAGRRAVVEWTAPELPADKPRYLMGLGTPRDLLHAVEQGVDLFDCVLPTRNARHGILFTRRGPLRIKNARFRSDPAPPDAACGCPLCRDHSRAYIHHLMRAGELTGAVLGTLHNLRFYLDFVAQLREGISLGKLTGAVHEIAARYEGSGEAVS